LTEGQGNRRIYDGLQILPNRKEARPGDPERASLFNAQTVLFYQGKFFNDAGITGKFINDEKHIADINIDGTLK
jgi:hypothetical protein